MNKPFNNWEKLSQTLSSHSKLKYHIDSVQAVDALKSTIEYPKSRMDVVTSTTIQSQLTKNTHVLSQIVCAIIYLAKVN